MAGVNQKKIFQITFKLIKSLVKTSIDLIKSLKTHILQKRLKKNEIQYPEQDEIENKKMETNEKINKKVNFNH